MFPHEPLKPTFRSLNLSDLSRSSLDARNAAVKDLKCEARQTVRPARMLRQLTETQSPYSDNAARYLRRLAEKRRLRQKQSGEEVDSVAESSTGSSPSIKLSVLICGGGICGLSSAIAVARQGHRVSVLEAAEKIEAIGAGIQIAPNASRHLFRWGVESELRTLIVHPVHLMTRRWDDGSAIGIIRTRELQDRYGSPFVQIHRGDLHHSLYSIAQKLGVEFRTGAKVASYDFEQTMVTLENGEVVGADLIISADGVRSVARAQIDRESFTSSISADYVAYRAPIPVEEVLADAQLRWTVEEPHQNCWAGPDRHAQTYSMHGNEMLNMVFVAPIAETIPYISSDEDNEDMIGSTRSAGSSTGLSSNSSSLRSPQSHWKAELKAHFAGWDPVLFRLIELADPARVGKWPVWSAPHLQAWSPRAGGDGYHGAGNDAGNGAVLILGDAAHDMTPYLGQGAAQAIEDAAVLGELISGVGWVGDGDSDEGRRSEANKADDRKTADLAAVIELVQAFRQPRSSLIRRLAEGNFATWQLPDGEVQRERDRLAAADVKPGEDRRVGGSGKVNANTGREMTRTEEKRSEQGPSPYAFVDPIIQPWLYGTDVVEEIYSIYPDL